MSSPKRRTFLGVARGVKKNGSVLVWNLSGQRISLIAAPAPARRLSWPRGHLPRRIAPEAFAEPCRTNFREGDRMTCRGTAAKRPVNSLEQFIDLAARVPAHGQRKGPHELTITRSERVRLSAAQVGIVLEHGEAVRPQVEINLLLRSWRAIGEVTGELRIVFHCHPRLVRKVDVGILKRSVTAVAAIGAGVPSQVSRPCLTDSGPLRPGSHYCCPPGSSD